LLQTSSEVEIVAGSKETGMLALEDNFRTRWVYSLLIECKSDNVFREIFL
jgi:hypothetical protein